ncbi:MAG: TrkA family potassium uptake protein [Bacteroidales bacterium]|jgi:trk system potassium uptake protein TrkA|nr:TrkA family potassium uptake protein [Bacteroidales bacterium]
MKSDNRFAIIGAGQFGSAIARSLAEKGAEVLVIDAAINKVQEIADDVAYAVCLDVTNKKALIAENIIEIDVIIVAIGNDFNSRLLCVANLMDIGVKRIVCRTMGRSERLILEKMGVTEFLSPEDEIGTLFAERLINPNILSYLKLPDSFQIAEISTPSRLVGKTIGSIDFRDLHHLSLITLKRSFEEDIANPTLVTEHTLGVPETSVIIQQQDTFVLFGKTNDIENFIKINQ